MPSFHDWKTRLERILEASHDRSVNALFRDLNTLTKALGQETCEALLDAHPELFKYRAGLTEAYRQFVLKHDRMEAHRILADDGVDQRSYADVASGRLAALHKARNAVLHQVDFRDCRRFVLVGCGRNPFTIFHIHDATNVPELVGLDVVPEAVSMATRMAAKLGYGRAKIELIDGRKFDYQGAQVVHVTSTLSNKTAVISRIADTAPQDVRLILREPCGLGRLWVERAEDTLDPRIEIVGRARNSQGPITDVYATRRGDSAA